MITIPEIVEDIVRHSPFLEEALGAKIINLSSFARIIKPQIEEKLLRQVQVGAVMMALKRLEVKLEDKKQTSSPLLNNLGDITVRSNLSEFTFTNSPTLLDRVRELLMRTEREKSAFLAFTHGVFETTLIISALLSSEVEDIFSQEHLRSKFSDLSSITLILPKESVQTPGVYYNILKTLAWEGINLIEVISNYTELTLILEESQVDKAFSVLKNLG